MLTAVFCPNCGGPAKITDTQCNYCGVGLVNNGTKSPLKLIIQKDFARGIPSAVLMVIRKAFLESEVCESNATIRAFCERVSLKPFRNSIPEASSISTRVDMLITYLNGITRAQMDQSLWYDHKNMLMVFVIELYALAYAEDKITQEMQAMINQLVELGYLEKV